MENFFDYIMRRKPLLLLFLAAFLASGIFSYNIFIKSQTVIDEHIAATTTHNEMIEAGNLETETISSEPEVVAEVEIEIPHTGETEEATDDSLISNGANLENEDIGDMQSSPELPIPHTGLVENAEESWTPPAVVVAGLLVLAVATILFGLYFAVMHFLR